MLCDVVGNPVANSKFFGNAFAVENSLFRPPATDSTNFAFHKCMHTFRCTRAGCVQCAHPEAHCLNGQFAFSVVQRATWALCRSCRLAHAGAQLRPPRACLCCLSDRWS